MKFGLFIALLVLLASINVFGQDSNVKKGRGKKTGGEELQKINIKVDGGREMKTDGEEGQNINIDVDGGRGRKTVSEERQKININVDGGREMKTDGEEGQNINIDVDGGRGRKTVGEKGGVTQTKVTIDNNVPVEHDEVVQPKDSKRKTITVTNHVESDGGSSGIKSKPGSTVVSVKTGKGSIGRGGDKLEEEEEHLPESVDAEQTHIEKPGKQLEVGTEDDNEEIRKEGKPGSKVNVSLKKKPVEESQEENEESDPRGSSIKVVKPTVELIHSNDKAVRVRGSILLVKYVSTLIETVKYDSRDPRFGMGHPTTPVKALFSRDFIARQSRVTLYVSTKKTTDPKLAFAQFPIKFQEDHFPLTFDIDVELPNQQRGLLQRADITLYFFVYVNNLETRVDTFVPAGTSQILLQGTNQLVQRLDVYVKASGIEISGLFRGRFGSKYIRTGTSYQVFIVPQQSLSLLRESSFESIAQLTLNNLPSMLPVPFSMLVNNQMLKSNTKYFAIAYIFENGVRRLLNQEPIWVINEQKTLVTPQVIFNVIPSPFMLVGSVTRSMPGLYNLQDFSKLVLRIREIGSNSPDIIFKLSDIISLPQRFQVNMSSIAQFDSSKRYEVRAIILDEKNNIYMATLQPIPLLDDFSNLIIPVDDLLHYVTVTLRSSSNQKLTYVPGSSVQVLVSETPDAPSKPIVSLRIDSISADFREFQIQVPTTALVRGKSYYLIMIIEINGMITHVSKTLLISNNQPPPLTIQLPVLSLNLITGSIFDLENRPPQWSSSSYATIYLLDSKIENPEKAVVQSWKIHLENDFPVRFEVLLDFSRLLPNRIYRLQAAIENGRSLLEYKPAGSVLVINSAGGIISDVRLPVTNVKTFQVVQGLIYINDFQGPLPEKGVIIVQLSSSPSLSNPSVIEEIRIQVEGRTLPIDFSMKLPLTKIDINAVYYFLVQYTVQGAVIIPSRQLFAFSPRNDAKVTITLSKTPQIPITGKVTSTGGPLVLPKGAILHLYITNNLNEERPVIYSEVFLEASLNSVYDFTMNVNSLIIQQKNALYLRADILYKDKIILSIPRPALLQITLGAQWNINLVIDLPTVVVGRIVSISEITKFGGNLDVLIEFFDPATKKVVIVRRIRLGDKLPLEIRLTIENSFFVKYQSLQARAVVKNCKGQVIFQSGSTANIELGLNVDVTLSIVLSDQKNLIGLEESIDETASMKLGKWSVSAVGLKHESDFNSISSVAIDLAQK